jgi:hypothetical protein
VFSVKHFHHRLLIDSHHRAIGHCGCGAQAERLSCKATLSEEIALVQNAYCGFLPELRHNGEFYLSFLYIENSIGRIALSKDRLLFGKSLDLPAGAVDCRKECFGIELAEFLGRCRGWHDWPLSRIPVAQKAPSYDEGRINAQEGREQRQVCGQISYSARQNNDFTLDIESQSFQPILLTSLPFARRPPRFLWIRPSDP